MLYFSVDVAPKRKSRTMQRGKAPEDRPGARQLEGAMQSAFVDTCVLLAGCAGMHVPFHDQIMQPAHAAWLHGPFPPSPEAPA